MVKEDTVVIGVGSVLRKDDAIGIRLIERLEKEFVQGDVRFVAGDISGMDLLKFFPEKGQVIILDAALMGIEPGGIKVFTPEDIEPASFKEITSTHGMELLETITLARKLGLDAEIVIIGIQPESSEFGLDMTGTIEDKMPDLVRRIKDIITERTKI